MKGWRQSSAIENLRTASNRRMAGNAESHVWLADWKKYGLPHCSLYLVSPDNDWPCKVGISTHAARRVGQIQISVWRPVKVDYSVWCKSVADARLLERAIHSTLAEDGKWLNGEWFDMRPDATKELIQFKAAILGIECFDTVTEPAIVADIERMLAYYSDGELAIRINRYRA
ncbi:GIY-YIG nuclease family protein [Mesorhizobium sp. M1A.F.Ca.IN.022.02.1.1]|uniref:GIY-YIG nuclease family protein n=1 Tax=Mesorhizobium sp. M1A.F.Ca.IN.022.02.1.1 TaxID=2496766 RepID=UPI000FCA9815|nr:GIY-YIG nuclease family protein [Mesorhizobium sp. M1A.F.Ca.IN.022.02.1.1]RUV65827.1 GIY-YIG nuclease family protein [Mesorhizobium sp. M1A.F.Ca.IN.022.02.1.1]RWI33421.1 MAG: GIY-YIG nuclease family protein [Mesorhizobium sp.]